MAGFTYDTLIESIYAFTAESADDELGENIDSIVLIAQTELQRDLELEIFVENQNQTLSQGSTSIQRPSSMVELASLYIQVGTQRKYIPQRSYDFCRMYAPNPTEQAEPAYWAEDDQTKILIVPAANASYAYFMRFHAHLIPLSPTNQSNWLSLNVPDLLLFKCLEHSERFIVNITRSEMWKGQYDANLPEVKAELGSMKRVSPERLKIRPTPMPPPEVADGD